MLCAIGSTTRNTKPMSITNNDVKAFFNSNPIIFFYIMLSTSKLYICLHYQPNIYILINALAVDIFRLVPETRPPKMLNDD